jgi:tRNA(Ile)-lysidine synthase
MQLLCDYARQTASAVLFAHHYDDQAETVAMRLARGSAVMGLSAIAAIRIYQGVLFVRPFLELRKSDLIAVCKAYKAEYITDPSNTDQAFERARVRAWLQQPDQRRLQQQLVHLSSLSAQLSERLEDTLAEWCAANIVFTLRLRAQINSVTFSELNEAKQNLILRHCLSVIGGQPYYLSDNRLDRTRVRLANGVRSTAGDCLVQGNAERITIMAEFGRMPEPELTVQAGRIYRFDKRWLIRTTKDGVIRRLGPAGWAKWSQSSNFQSLSNWTARMGAMIPVLHGLDGRRYCPHFIKRRFVYSGFAFNPAQHDPVATRAFCASSLPLDGPCEVIKTDINDR